MQHARMSAGWRRAGLYTAALVGLLLSTAAAAGAQTTLGSIGGTVRDGQGAPIPGVNVTVTSASRGATLTTVTNETGAFVLLNLLPDTYVMKVTMDGFKTFEQQNVVLTANAVQSVGIITLELGAMTETVTVASRIAELQTRSAERSFAIESSAIENLAVNGRNPLTLARIAPGVANPGDVSMNVNGSRGNTHNFTVDGVSNLDTGNNGVLGNINLDAVEEFKLLTNGYQAEYGRSSGAQISLVTKSGGRDYKGSMYWYRRHEGLNANSWLNNRDGRVKQINRQNDVGYTVGGPVPLPGLSGDRSRLFFFFAQEHQRRMQPENPQRVKVPTALERQGDFSQSVDNNGNPFPYIKDPLKNGSCRAGATEACFQDGGVLGRIPQNRLYPLGQAIMNVYPLPNDIGQGYNYTSQVSQDRNRREDIARVDWQASDKWRLYGRYIHNTNNAGLIGPYGSFVLGANVPLTNISDVRPVHNFGLSATGVLSPSLFIETTFGYGHNELNIFDLDGKVNRASLGLSALPLLYPDAVKDDYPPQFQFGGRAGTSPNIGSNNAPFYNFNTTYDFLTNLTKVWGRHTSKAGIYVQRSKKDQSGFGANNGIMNFADNTANPLDTGYAYANAALGVFNFYEQASIWPVGEYRYWNVEWYAQDNWKVNDRLTLDYGLRFYWVQPQYDRAKLTSNFLPDLFNSASASRLYRPFVNGNGERVGYDPVTGQQVNGALIGRIVPNSGDLTNGLRRGGDGISDYLIEDQGILFAPRFGLTYDITGRQDLILRAGGGVFYDRYEGNIPFDQIVNPPTTFAPRLSFGQLQDVNPANALLAPSGLNAMNYSGEIPTVYNFNLGLQKKLPWSMIADIAYVGSVQNHLPRRVNINAVPYGAAFAPQNQDPTRTGAPSQPGANALPQDFLRPYPGYGNINMRLFDANANYHSLQTQVDRRFSNGLFMNVNYTWSKAMSRQDNNGAFSRIDEFDGLANYARADFDRTHIFNVNWVYELPRKQSAGAVMSGLLNNWQLSGGYRWETGQPYTVEWAIDGIGNRNITGSDTEGFRPVINGDVRGGNLTDPYNQLPPNIWSPSAVGSIGLESGRNYVNRAPVNNLDLSLQKSFSVFGGRRALRFRVDAFNALNHTQFNEVNRTIRFRSLTDPTPTNLPYDTQGNLVNRTSGFGTVSSVRANRVIQLLARFEF